MAEQLYYIQQPDYNDWYLATHHQHSVAEPSDQVRIIDEEWQEGGESWVRVEELSGAFNTGLPCRFLVEVS